MHPNNKISWIAGGRPGALTAIAFAMAIVTFGLSSTAHAANADSPCMQDAYTLKGGGSLNCSANDLSLTQLNVTNADVSDPCTAVGDTWTFTGNIQLAPRSNERYDLGFYIGTDGVQALTGTCHVATVDTSDFDNAQYCSTSGIQCTANADCGGGQTCLSHTPLSVDLDSDTCGDFTKFGNQVPVGTVTALCTDGDNNGFFDVVVCAAYDNNAGSVCGGLADAVPGGPSKCQCATINTTQSVPRCATNAECADSNPCTTDTCLVSGGDLFGCSNAAGNAGTTCRNSTGACDPAETCSGTSTTCPADSLSTTATICRPASGVCDAAERCDGASVTCPADSPATSGTTCRASAGVCDTAETCDGASTTCPADSFSSGNTCRGSAGVCDVAETCSGASANCPADGFNTGATCRGSAGVCDVAETCSGASANCPADGFNTGATCRGSAGVCDVAETCGGASANCPADSFNTGATCRGSAGECDIAETCTGASASCPADAFQPSSQSCTAGFCDGLGTCQGCGPDGSSCDDSLYCNGADTCQSGVCTHAGDPCSGGADCADTCNEAADTCFDPLNTACNTDNNGCTTDVCNGAGVCQHNDNTLPCDDGLFCNGADTCAAGSCSGHAGDPCSGGADCADTCNETADTCFDANATPCTDDSNVCTDDVCDGAGTCAHTPNAVSCDDGLFCNGPDVCGSGTCGHAGDPCAGGPLCANVCDETDNNCLVDDGTSCSDDCTNGTCSGGVCQGTESLLSPSCRWIVIGGVGPVSEGNTVKTTGVRNDAGSTMDGSSCGFFSKRSRGVTLGHFVVSSQVGQGIKGFGIKFSVGADVVGDIVTGGSGVRVGHVGEIPGTILKEIPTGQVVDKLDDDAQATGAVIDTTGTHPLAGICDEDQDKLADAVPILDGLPSDVSGLKFKVKPGGQATFDATGMGTGVFNYTSVKISGRAQVHLIGGPTDVVIIRSAGDIKIGYGTHVLLEGGLVPENVLFYGKGRRCKMGRRVEGAGTWFCPAARKFQIGFGAVWTGTAMGGVKEVRIRRRAEFDHAAFLGL